MHRLPKLLLTGAATAAAAVAITPATGGAASHAAYSAQDKSWLQMEIQGDRFEMDGGRIAERRGSAGVVKALGVRLRNDHLKALKEAERLAASLDIGRPGKPTDSQQWELGAV